MWMLTFMLVMSVIGSVSCDLVSDAVRLVASLQ